MMKSSICLHSITTSEYIFVDQQEIFPIWWADTRGSLNYVIVTGKGIAITRSNQMKSLGALGFPQGNARWWANSRKTHLLSLAIPNWLLTELQVWKSLGFLGNL